MRPNDETTSFHYGSNKRPAAPVSGEPSRKRAPYASRACDVCRRRKGRCSGDNPCSYCVERSLECGVSTADRPFLGGSMGKTADDSSAACPIASPPQSATSARLGSSLRTPERTLSTTTERDGLYMGRGTGTGGLESLVELVSNLQTQMNTLTSRIQNMEESGSMNNNRSFNRRERPPRKDMQRRPPRRKRFCGPTSPDYSLNIARMNIVQGNLGHRTEAGECRAPSLDETQSDDEESVEGIDDEMDQRATEYVSSRTLEKLTAFTRLLSMDDAIKLMDIYQEIFGEFHPIVDMNRLVEQSKAWYSRCSESYHVAGPPTDETVLLTINLALAVAVCVEPAFDIKIAKGIYVYCRDSVNKAICSPTPGINNAVVALLVGVYHFFRDDARFSWRMCGLAGNMLLEMGLHTREFPEHMLGPDHDREQVVAIICTTIVFDRQWSAATGLPTHFQESHFQHAMKSPVEAPYLKAMVTFMAVSDKFTSPILRIAATGQQYDSDDMFEILNLQIQNWRKKAVGPYNLAQDGCRSRPINQIPSWAILLNLRANAAHCMLLRPFFFTNQATSASRKNIEPALFLISDTIDILWSLDRMTDVYRKQQPFYVHLLVSACALMYLVIAHVAQHRDSLSHDLLETFDASVRRDFRKAASLSSAYMATSRASRKLWKRLMLMREPLTQLGILSSEREHDSTRDFRRILDNSRLPQEAGSAWEGDGRSGQDVPGSIRDDEYRAQAPLPEMAATMAGIGEDRRTSIQGSRDAYGRNTASHLHPQSPTDRQFQQEMPMPMMPSTMGVETPIINGESVEAYGPIPPPANGTMFYGWPMGDGLSFFSEGELLWDE